MGTVADMRRNYSLGLLLESNTSDNPYELFAQWLQAAVDANMHEPNAMCISTVSSEGKPSSRMVLLKEYDSRGFVFFTNYTSRKARELDANPYASLVFWWDILERQVRVEGRVEKVSLEETYAYFVSRPRESRLGAYVSRQSQVIAGRHVLEERMQMLLARYEGHEIPCPDFWGGYRVIPTDIEFWQGRPNRLHDRLHYNLSSDSDGVQLWQRVRLSP